MKPESDGIITAEVARANKTFGAVILNCEHGLGEQAMMLNRSLFEGMAVAHWVSANPELAVEMFEGHWHHHRSLLADSVDKLGWWDEIGPRPEPPSPEELAKYRKLFGKYGNRIWTGHGSIYGLLQAIQSQWDDDGETLWTTYRVPIRESNALLHSTAHGLTSTVTSSRGDAIEFSIGPSEEAIDAALNVGHWSYAQTITLAIDHFKIPGGDRFREEFADGIYEFRVGHAERAGDIKRNDRCPCENGKKYKHCHGA